MIKSLEIWSVGTAVAAALMLTACHPTAKAGADGNSYALPALPATLPLEAGTLSAPSYAPTADALPAAPRVRTVRVADPRNSYAYADDAWDFGDAIFDAPPDYGFDYAGVEPWAWQSYDQSLTFVEPIDHGYRYYYYRPGADEPYFVRDPDYGYGYDNGQLAVIYGAGGTILPYDDYGPRIDYASRYLARGRTLYAVSRERDRRAVNAANWAARSAAISAAQSRWAAERSRQVAWRDYHQRVAIDTDRHWQEERARRQADAQRFAAWRRTDYRTAPPPRVIPTAWQQARWARDNRHYTPLPAPAPAIRDMASDQTRRAQVATARHQIQQQREGARRQEVMVQRQQQQALAGQQRVLRDADVARAQTSRATQQATDAQRRAAMIQQREALRLQQRASDQQRQQAQTQVRGAQQIRERAMQGQAQAAGRAQAQAARSQQQLAAREQARSRERAIGQAQAQAKAAQQVRSQAQAAHGRAEAQARVQAQAAHAQMRAARVEAQPARRQPQPRPAAPPPPAQPKQHGGGGGDHGGHGRHPG